MGRVGDCCTFGVEGGSSKGGGAALGLTAGTAAVCKGNAAVPIDGIEPFKADDI